MSQHTILIIDDNDDLRENTAELLALAGYRTLVAEDGKKGVSLVLSGKPDLVVCDIMMPGLDGYGVLHLVRISGRAWKWAPMTISPSRLKSMS